MNRLNALVARVLADLRDGRHIEKYAIAVVSFGFAIFSLISDALPAGVRTSAIFAALGVLVFNSTRPAQVKASIEDYLQNRSELGLFADRVKKARKLWIYGPSATNVLDGDNLDAIRQQILNHPKGELRVIIQNPDATEAVRVLKRQLDELVKFQHQKLPEEIAKTLAKFETIKGWKPAGTFAHGMLEYSPGFSIVIFDPAGPNGTVIVEFYGWRLQSTGDRMSVEISQAASPRWFDYWVEQYEYMWNDANPSA